MKSILTTETGLGARVLALLRDERTTAWIIFFTISLVFITAVSLLQLGVSGDLIKSDGKGYFAHLPSILLEGNIDYRNEMSRLQLPLRNHWTIGTAISWLPFFLVGHLLTKIGVITGQPWPVDGMGYPEQLLCCFGTVVYGAAAVALSYRIARRWFGPYCSFFGTFFFFSASNLPYYLLAEPYMSHGVSAFWSALLLYVSVKEEALTRSEWLKVGLLAGMCALTRPQDGLFLAAPFLWHILRKRSWKELCLAIVATGLISASMFSVQVVIWKHGLELEHGKHFHQSIEIPVVTKATTSWTSPRLGRQLVGYKNGLIPWHPIFLLAWLGLALLFREKPRLAAVFLTATLIQLYVVGAWGGQGQSFGGRMLLGAFSYFNLGVVTLLSVYGPRARRLVGALGILLVIQSLYIMVRYRMVIRDGDYAPKIYEILWPGS